MKSGEHFVAGALTSAALVAALPDISGVSESAAFLLYGVLLSVFVDLDHFVVARWMAGDWSHLRACLSDPVFAFTEQERVFEGVETHLLETRRLLSHALVGGVLTAGTAVVWPTLGVFTAVVLYVHVVADLLRDGGLA